MPRRKKDYEAAILAIHTHNGKNHERIIWKFFRI